MKIMKQVVIAAVTVMFSQGAFGQHALENEHAADGADGLFMLKSGISGFQADLADANGNGAFGFELRFAMPAAVAQALAPATPFVGFSILNSQESGGRDANVLAEGQSTQTYRFGLAAGACMFNRSFVRFCPSISYAHFTNIGASSSLQFNAPGYALAVASKPIQSLRGVVLTAEVAQDAATIPRDDRRIRVVYSSRLVSIGLPL